MSGISKQEVVAAAAVKRFREMIKSYDGPPEKLGEHLLRKLDETNVKADHLLAQILDEII